MLNIGSLDRVFARRYDLLQVARQNHVESEIKVSHVGNIINQEEWD